MYRSTRPLLAAILVSTAGLSCRPAVEPYASAYRIETLDQRVGGAKALSNIGDFVLENGHLRAGILAATNPDGSERHSPGPGTYGGGMVDADLMLPTFRSGDGNDAFAELMPTANMNVIKTDGAESVRIVSDGSDGGNAVIRVEGVSEPFITLLGALWGITRAPDFHITTDYIAEPGVPWLRLKSIFEYGPQAPSADPQVEPMGYRNASFPLIDWAIERGVVGGDFYLQGGSVDVFAPGIGFDEDGAVYEAELAGVNPFNEPFEFDFVGGVADGISYGLAPIEGKAYVPLFTASQTVVVGAGRDGDGSDQRFPPGTALGYERFFFVGHGDIASIYDQYLEARGLPWGEIEGHVIEANTGEPVSGADVFVYAPGAKGPQSQFETDINPLDSVPDGSFTGRLPPGDWELQVHQLGRPLGDRIPITVTENETMKLALEAPQNGALTFVVRDESDRRVPSKVTIVSVDEEPTRSPVLGDGFIGGSPHAVVFAPYGAGTVELPPGTYQAMASRGIEYEIDVSEPFTIGEDQGARIELMVEHSVLTDGWISADLHVHGIASHDSGVSRPQRVSSMVAEGVEFFSSTDHDFIVDYAPVVEEMGLSEWVQTAIGVETTTIEIGHFLGFPVEVDHLAEAGGAFDWTAHTPLEMLDAMRERGAAAGAETMTFVGHPRDGILGYFDQFGLDPYAGQPTGPGAVGVPRINRPLLSITNPLLIPGNVTWDFDGLEMLNGKRFELIRTPTKPEQDGFKANTGVDVYDMMTRTMEEQQALIDGTYTLAPDVEGHVDDWFTLLNLGFRHTLLGNSDTHGTTSVESGCPRNFVMAETDDPAFLDDQAVADAIKDHRVVASYGPFLRFWIDGEPVGGEIVTDGPLEMEIDVQAPTWMGVDRVELYENGTLIREWNVDDAPIVERFHEVFTHQPEKDAWYVVVVAGDDDMFPVFTPVEIPHIDLQTVVIDALSGLDSVAALVSPATPIPLTYPTLPYAITNPIWVDREGDGFQAPGLPDWLEYPEE